MRFNLSNPLHARQAMARLEHLIEKGAIADLTQKRKQRTYSQNAYLHLILTSWGQELGMDLDEMKQMVKTHLSPSLFQYKKRGVRLYRSTAQLNTKEMTTLIDKIRVTAMESTGFYIPEPHEQELLRSMANETERYA